MGWRDGAVVAVAVAVAVGNGRRLGGVSVKGIDAIEARQKKRFPTSTHTQ